MSREVKRDLATDGPNGDSEAKDAACYEHHVADGDGDVKDVPLSIWHSLAAWVLLAEIVIIGGILLVLAVRGCS